MTDSRQRPPRRVGLALGSGSARGWAHIGVIRALAEAGIRVDCVAGTSIGALVGAVYAAGKMDTLEDIVLHLDWKQVLSFFDVVFPRSGLIDGKTVADSIRGRVQERHIEELPLPFCAVSTDLGTGREVVLRSGDLIEAVRASISVPGIFTPVRKNGTILVDGGLVNPVPVSVARDMGADFVIAVNLNHDIVVKKGIGTTDSAASSSDTETSRPLTRGRKIVEALNRKLEALDTPALSQLRRLMAWDPLPNIFEVLGSSINIMEARITASRLEAEPPDLLIQPNLGHIRFLEFHRAREAIAEGFRETMIQVSGLTGK